MQEHSWMKKRFLLASKGKNILKNGDKRSRRTIVMPRESLSTN
jgi:hypothetical protein